MMKIVKYKIILFMIILLPFVLGGCDKFEERSEGPAIEHVKDLSGSWKVVEVSRNNVNITSFIDFGKFTLNLYEDNTYSIENFMPFMVKGSGTWGIDDPLYPYYFTIQETGGDPITSSFSFPVVKGKRRIILTMTNIGCADNKYVYSFEKVTN